MYICITGECVSTPSDCPQLPSCPVGFKLCENRECISIYEECDDIYTSINMLEKDKNWYRCPSGDIAANRYLCPGDIVCPPNTYKCPDSSCISFDASCVTPNKCNEGLIWCPSGGCALSLHFCGPLPKCGLQIDFNGIVTATVLCSDLTCQPTASYCSILDSCPPERPVRCPTGICAEDFNLCVPPRLCPSDTPVACEDGSCVATVLNCKSATSCPRDYYRCPSGTCAASVELCPSTVKCLPPGVYCYDYSCREFSEEARSRDVGESPDFIPCTNYYLENYAFAPCTCGNSSVVYCGTQCLTIEECPNYFALYVQCVQSKLALVKEMCQHEYDSYPCPTSFKYSVTNVPSFFSAFCPSSTPFICPDRTCHSSLSECTHINTCTHNQVLCNDGSCKNHYKECNDISFCPLYSPYKCISGQCVTTPEDCFAMNICTESKPFRCFDNICVADQNECNNQPICKPNEILCQDFLCYTDINTTSSLYLYSLPVLYENTCDLLHDTICPHGYMRCPNGACAVSILMCTERSCPLYAPYLCPDGTCAMEYADCTEMCTNSVFCPRYNTATKTISWKRICCSSSYEECCYPRDYTYLSLLPPLPECESDKVLCGDGSCRDKSSCVNADGCSEETPYRCISGECVAQLSDCTSTYLCPKNQYHCSDGRCVTSSLFCSYRYDGHKRCPDDRPVMCANGECQKTYQQCLSISSCPSDKPYRCNNNVCVYDSSECSNATICYIENYVMVQRGRYSGSCVPDQARDFFESVSICNHDQPFLCSNNQCEETDGSCKEYTNDCPLNTPYKCPDDTCAKSKYQCVNANYCSLEKPFKCRNSICVVSPKDCEGVTFSTVNSTYICPDGTVVESFLSCLTSQKCPSLTPYKCKDGTCVAKDKFSSVYTCNATTVCPSFSSYLCGDGSCAIKPEFCPYITACYESQYLCSDQTCVENNDMCQYTQNTCPIGNPIKCIDGSCVNNGNLCPLAKCSVKTPYPCVFGTCVSDPYQCPNYPCKDGEINCWDGSCAKEFSLCTIFPSCPAARPTRCYDGSCVYKPSDCPSSKAPTCPEGTKLCPCGLCASECAKYYGCEAGSYMCSNSTCVTLTPEMFDSSFNLSAICTNKCVGGSCVSRTINLFQNYYVITLSTRISTPIPIVYSNHKHILSVLLPERLFLYPKSNYYLIFSGVPSKNIPLNYYVHLNNDTSLTHLTLQETLFSPVIMIDIRTQDDHGIGYDVVKFRLPIVLYFTIGNNPYPVSEMCLAVFNTTILNWQCVSDISILNNLYIGSIKETVFGVIILVTCIVLIILFSIYIVKYKHNIAKANVIINEETKRKQRDITYNYNPLLVDIKTVLSLDQQKYELSQDDHYEQDQLETLKLLEKEELFLQYSIEKIHHSKSTKQ
ncbi:hypothetical protein WA158_005316 [Blastocystis sp. Blastoise]